MEIQFDVEKLLKIRAFNVLIIIALITAMLFPALLYFLYSKNQFLTISLIKLAIVSLSIFSCTFGIILVAGIIGGFELTKIDPTIKLSEILLLGSVYSVILHCFINFLFLGWAIENVKMNVGFHYILSSYFRTLLLCLAVSQIIVIINAYRHRFKKKLD